MLDKLSYMQIPSVSNASTLLKDESDLTVPISISNMINTERKTSGQVCFSSIHLAFSFLPQPSPQPPVPQSHPRPCPSLSGQEFSGPPSRPPTLRHGSFSSHSKPRQTRTDTHQALSNSPNLIVAFFIGLQVLLVPVLRRRCVHTPFVICGLVPLSTHVLVLPLSLAVVVVLLVPHGGDSLSLLCGGGVPGILFFARLARQNVLASLLEAVLPSLWLLLLHVREVNNSASRP